MNKKFSAKKFRGWVVPNKHRSHLVGSVVGLRNSAHVFGKGESISGRTTLERFVYVGCVHGGNSKIYDLLNEISKSRPDYVIFIGDLTGSPETENLKSKFYQEKARENFKEYEYFGNWIAQQSRNIRQTLITSIGNSTSKLLKKILTIKKHCSHVVLLEGNWDNPVISGVKMIAGKDIKDNFQTKEEFRRSGLSLVDRLETIETDATLHILLPYITLLYFGKISKDRLREVAYRADTVRREGKTIVMVGHAEANWKIHHLSGDDKLFGERAIVVSNFGRAIALFQPHEVIYPHQHAKLQDEQGEVVDVDTKYLLAVERNTERVRLVNDADSNQIQKDEVIATYLPFGYVAEEDFLV